MHLYKNIIYSTTVYDMCRKSLIKLEKDSNFGEDAVTLLSARNIVDRKKCLIIESLRLEKDHS